MRLYRTTVPSMLGALVLTTTDAGLTAVQFASERPGRVALPAAQEAPRHALLRRVAQQLDAYLIGRRRDFAIALDARGTAFQHRVWQAVRAIPYGQTRSYGALAQALGRPDATRAVGAAIGRNPLCIVVPCHRVVGSTGKLTGFAGGLAAKRALLTLERQAMGTDAGPDCPGAQRDLWPAPPEASG